MEGEECRKQGGESVLRKEEEEEKEEESASRWILGALDE